MTQSRCQMRFGFGQFFLRLSTALPFSYICSYCFLVHTHMISPHYFLGGQGLSFFLYPTMDGQMDGATNAENSSSSGSNMPGLACKLGGLNNPFLSGEANVTNHDQDGRSARVVCLNQPCRLCIIKFLAFINPKLVEVIVLEINYPSIICDTVNPRCVCVSVYLRQPTAEMSIYV